MITVIRDRLSPAMSDVPGIEGAELADALTREWPCDAHFVAYEPMALPVVDEDRTAVVRLLHERDADTDRPSYYEAREALDLPPVRMQALVGDVDGPGHVATPEWRAETEAKLAALGAMHYATRNGYRVVMPLPSAFLITKPEDAETWKRLYLGWCEHIEQAYGIALDRKCKDWTRLMRLPNVLRDGKPARAVVHNLAKPREFDYDMWEEPKDAPAAPTPAVERSAALPDRDAERVARAVRVAESMPASVEGLGGERALYVATREIAAQLGDDADAIETILREVFNPRCLPEWPAAKLRYEARGAAEWQRKPEQKYAARKEDARRAAAELRLAASDAEPDVDPWDAPLRFDTPDEPIDYYCDGLKIAPSKGKITVIAGQPGAGKGPTADYLAVCFALGLRAFDKFECSRKRTMILDFEGARLTMRRCRRLARGLGVDAADLQDELIIYDGNSLGYIGEEYALDRLEAKVRSLGVEVLVVDSYITANLPSGLEPNAPGFANLAKALAQLGICVIVIAHANKASAKEDRKPRLSDIAYTGAFAALAQTAIVMHKPAPEEDENVIEIGCARAPEEGFPSFSVRFTGHRDEPLTVRILDGSGGEADAAPRRDRDVERMRKELTDLGRDADTIERLLRADPNSMGLSARKAAVSTGMTGPRAGAACMELLKRGTVVPHSLATDKEVWYRLADLDVPPPSPGRYRGLMPRPGEVATKERE